MSSNYMQSSSHLFDVLNPEERQNVINWIVQALEGKKDEFDAIAVSGSSGLLVGPSVADHLQKNIILVRTNKGGHSDYLVEGPKDGRYVIVDDLIDTGRTVKRIVRGIHTQLCEHSQCVGLVMYHSCQREIAFGKRLGKRQYKKLLEV